MAGPTDKLAKMAEHVRTGGKGSVRRKMKAVHRTVAADDKKLEATLKRIGMQQMPADEVNMFKTDGTVIHFVNPKLRASIQSNTFVVSGTAEHKKLQDLLPGIIPQLGPESLSSLKTILSSLRPSAGAAPAAAADDGVPELVGSVE